MSHVSDMMLRDDASTVVIVVQQVSDSTMAVTKVGWLYLYRSVYVRQGVDGGHTTHSHWSSL